jgi:hypothetical protein
VDSESERVKVIEISYRGRVTGRSGEERRGAVRSEERGAGRSGEERREVARSGEERRGAERSG